MKQCLPYSVSTLANHYVEIAYTVGMQQQFVNNGYHKMF